MSEASGFWISSFGAAQQRCSGTEREHGYLEPACVGMRPTAERPAESRLAGSKTRVGARSQAGIAAAQFRGRIRLVQVQCRALSLLEDL